MARHAILAHHDLDGLASALLLRHWLGEVEVHFVAHADLPVLLPRLLAEADRVWMVDLAPEGPAAWGAVRAAPGRVAILDHHPTARCDPALAVCEVDASGDRCAAEVVAGFLRRQGIQLPVALQMLVDYAHDQDLWIRALPEAARFNDAVEELGPTRVFELLAADAGRVTDWTPAMEQAAEEAASRRGHSLQLASATAVDRPFLNGWCLRVALCQGYVSEVGEALGGERTAVLLWDLDDLDRLQPSFHFRSRDPGLDLSAVAAELGGGGHPQASGAPAGWDWLQDWMLASAERLATVLGGDKPAD